MIINEIINQMSKLNHEYLTSQDTHSAKKPSFVIYVNWETYCKMHKESTKEGEHYEFITEGTILGQKVHRVIDNHCSWRVFML